MALYHDATITPTKAEMIAGWVPDQPWCPASDTEPEVLGAFRFDDPEGRVGMETHLVEVGGALLHVPLTYREAPLEGAEEALIGEMEHSALGTRWIYDGLGDPRYLTMLAAVALTGQGEALGMVVYKGRWYIAPTHVRIRAGGWTQKRVPVDEFEAAPSDDPDHSVFVSDRFQLTFHRRLRPGAQPEVGMTATWDGQAEPVVLAEIQPR